MIRCLICNQSYSRRDALRRHERNVHGSGKNTDHSRPLKEMTFQHPFSMMVTGPSGSGKIVQEPVIGLIKCLRPKGLKVCSYVEKYAEFKNQTLKKIGWYTKVLCTAEYPGVCNISKCAKMGVALQVYTLNPVITVVKCKFWQQTTYNDQCSI